MARKPYEGFNFIRIYEPDREKELKALEKVLKLQPKEKKSEKNEDKPA